MAATYSYGAAPTYVKIASYTSSGVNSFTFSNIPQGYTDLVIVFNGSISAFDFIYVQYNGDSGANYSGTILTGTGASAGSSRHSGSTYLQAIGWVTGIQNNANSILNIQNYSSSTIYKTLINRTNDATNGTQTYVGLWRNTAPITSITFTGVNSRTILSGSTFTIYGIKAALTPKATGGDLVVNDGVYWYHAFRSTGAFVPKSAITADVLTVAGGGSGGSDASGGGGAGGVYYAASQSLTVTNYTVTIGAGATGNSTKAAAGSSGSNSQFGALTAAVGGGSGGGGSGGAGSSGGSGGGSRIQNNAGTAGQGNQGGSGVNSGSYPAGGGGGAGSAGSAGSGTTGGAGGAGTNTYSSWHYATSTGVSGYIAGGGGGGVSSGTGGAAGSGGATAGVVSPNFSGNAAPNTGSGSGGAGDALGTTGNGGSGLVIVRYAV